MISFRILSVDVKVSFSAFALLTFAVVISGKDSLIPMCVISSLVHEVSHIVSIIRFSGKPRSISFSAEGLTILTERKPLSLKQEIIISSSGVISNFLLCIISFVTSNIFKQSILYDFSMCNLCLGVFNSLPLKSLDGGQMFYIMLRQKHSLRACDIILNVVSFIIIVPVAVSGILVLFVSRYNYSLLFVSIYLILVITSKEMR